MQEENMTNSHFTPSILHVTATEIDISKDLESEQTKSLGRLLEENNEEKTEENSGRERIPTNSGNNS